MKRRNFITNSLLFLTGCTTATTTSDLEKKSPLQLKKLRFAITDTASLEELEQDYGQFRNDLQEVLKTKIEFYPVTSYTAATPALFQNKLDLVWAGPAEYVILNSRAKVIPVIALTRPRYRSIIVVRADSGIKSLAQLKGKTIAVTNLGSTGSYFGSIGLLIKAGLNPRSDFKVVVLQDRSQGKKSLEALTKGEVDAWGVVIYRYEPYLKDRGLSQKDFPIIANGPLLPNDVFVANNNLSAQAIATIGSKMLANQDKLMSGIIAAQSKFKGGSLVAAKDSDYDTIRQVYRAIGQGSYIE